MGLSPVRKDIIFCLNMQKMSGASSVSWALGSQVGKWAFVSCTPSLCWKWVIHSWKEWHYLLLSSSVCFCGYWICLNGNLDCFLFWGKLLEFIFNWIRINLNILSLICNLILSQDIQLQEFSTGESFFRFILSSRSIGWFPNVSTGLLWNSNKYNVFSV